MSRDRDYLARELAGLGYSDADCVRLSEEDLYALLSFYVGRNLLAYAHQFRPAWLRREGRGYVFVGATARPGQPPLRDVAQRLEDAALQRRERFKAQQQRRPA